LFRIFERKIQSVFIHKVKKIREFLKTVAAPEFEIDIMNLGLVYGIDVQGGKVRISMTLTSIGCPTAGLLETLVKKTVSLVEGVEEVEVEWTFDPPWSPGMITEEGREFFEALGYI